METVDDARQTAHRDRKFQGEFLRCDILGLTLQGENTVAKLHLHGTFVQINARFPLQCRANFSENPVSL